MSTKPFSTDVPVSVPRELTKQVLFEFPAFKTWISTLQHSLSLQSKESHPFHRSPYTLRAIDVQSADFFGGDRLGFVKLKATVTNDDGERLPGSVFLRGGSVAMMLILQPDDVPADSEQDKYVILTVQPRIPAGSLSFAELPAGMLDDSGTFAGAAAKEIGEETGLEVVSSELLDMTRLALPDPPDPDEQLQAAVYPSCGGSDEHIPIFLWQKRLPRRQLGDWEGKLTGLRDRGEKITLRLARLEDAWKLGGRDAKTLAALALYQGLSKEGKI